LHAFDEMAASQIFFLLTQVFDKVPCYRRYYLRLCWWYW